MEEEENQTQVIDEQKRNVVLDGMGFVPVKGRGNDGLYKKAHKNGMSTMFWDFRKDLKDHGYFFVVDNGVDGYWDPIEARKQDEYIYVRKALGGEDSSIRSPEKRKVTVQKPEILPGANSLAKYGTATELRGTESEIRQLLTTKLRLESIIQASEDKKRPGEGILWYELKFGNKSHFEPSVELVDMIAQDMGNIETRIIEFGENILENPQTGIKYMTYYCHVEARDNETKTTVVAGSEQLVDFQEIEKNGRTFARTNAIRKAERNAKEHLIQVPRKAMVELVRKILDEYIASKGNRVA